MMKFQRSASLTFGAYRKNSASVGLTLALWLKIDQGQPRFIICTNLVGPTSPMLHTKSQGHWPFGSRVEDI